MAVPLISALGKVFFMWAAAAAAAVNTTVNTIEVLNFPFILLAEVRKVWAALHFPYNVLSSFRSFKIIY